MFRVAEMRCSLSNKACQTRGPRQAWMAGWHWNARDDMPTYRLCESLYTNPAALSTFCYTYTKADSTHYSKLEC